MYLHMYVSTIRVPMYVNIYICVFIHVPVHVRACTYVN